MVLVPTKEKVKIYTYFLQEGVFACRKDNTTKNEALDIPNLHCFLVMRSLISRKFATEIFSWQWHYYTLTPDGMKYLREYLGLPPTIYPKSYTYEESNEEEPKDEEGDKDKNEDNKDRRRGGRRREGGDRRGDKRDGERKGRGKPRGRGRKRGGDAEQETKESE